MKKWYLAILAMAALVLSGCKPGPITLGSKPSAQTNTQAVATTPAKNTASKANMELDAATQEQINQAVQTMLQTRQATSWQSKTAAGMVIPGHRYKQGVRVCQPYTVQITSKEQNSSVKSVACQTYKGQWVVVK